MTNINPLDDRVIKAIAEVEKFDKPLGRGFYIPIFGWIAAAFYLVYSYFSQRSALSHLKDLSILSSDNNECFEKINACLAKHGIVVSREDAQRKNRENIFRAYSDKFRTPNGRLQVETSTFKSRVYSDLIDIFGKDLWDQNDPPFPAQMVPFYLGLANLSDQEILPMQYNGLLDLAILILPGAETLKEACKKYPVDPQKVIKLKAKITEWQAALDKNEKLKGVLGQPDGASFALQKTLTSVVPGFVGMNEHVAGMASANMFYINTFWNEDYGHIDKNVLFRIVLTVSSQDDIPKNLKLFSGCLEKAPKETMKLYEEWTSSRTLYAQQKIQEKPLDPKQFVKVFKIALKLSKIYNESMASTLFDVYSSVVKNPEGFIEFFDNMKEPLESYGTFITRASSHNLS